MNLQYENFLLQVLNAGSYRVFTGSCPICNNVDIQYIAMTNWHRKCICRTCKSKFAVSPMTRIL